MLVFGEVNVPGLLALGRLYCIYWRIFLFNSWNPDCLNVLFLNVVFLPNDFNVGELSAPGPLSD